MARSLRHSISQHVGAIRSRGDLENYQAGRAKGGTIKINRSLPGSAG